MLAMLSVSGILLCAHTKFIQSLSRQLIRLVVSTLVIALCNYKQNCFSKEMTLINKLKKQKLFKATAAING